VSREFYVTASTGGMACTLSTASSETTTEPLGRYAS
jgi:hypothetical protein